MRAFFRKLFIPNVENEYAPHSLRTAAAIGMMTLIMFSFTAANLQSVLWITSEWMVSTILPSVIVTDTNEARAGSARQPLVRSEVLDAAATQKAEHMAENQYFAHVSPDGVTPWYWFDEAGYSFVHAGENLAVFFTDSSEIVEAWMDSPLHRDNILNDEFREIGIGVAEGEFEGHDTVYVVQLFGTPSATYFETTRSRTVSTEESETVVALEETAQPIVAGVSDESVATDTASVEVAVTPENAVVMYTDTVATSTGGVAAYVAPKSSDFAADPGVYAYATQPSAVLFVLYLLVGAFVCTALILSVVVEIRRQQPLQIAYSAGLIAMMLMLFEVHRAVLGGAIVM